MIKRNKLKIILSSVGIILPSLIILLLKGFLNTENSSLNPTGITFLMPLIFLAVHFVCIAFTNLDPKNREQNDKVFGTVLFVTPVLSWFVCAVFFMASMGYTFAVKNVTIILFGLLFIVIGNYMPKCKQNATIGIKIRPTLTNEENWLMTHRVAGKVWVICGIILLFVSFLHYKASLIASAALIIAAVIIPVAYSYWLYRKQLKNGAKFTPLSLQFTFKHKKLTAASIAVIFIIIIVIMFTGKMELDFTDTDLNVKITYWENFHLNYSEIDSAELREDLKIGYRTYGFSSATLSAGNYQNDELGHYILYKEKGAENYLILRTQKGIVVIADADKDTIESLYEKITNFND